MIITDQICEKSFKNGVIVATTRLIPTTKRDNKNKFLLFIIKKIEKFVYKNADIYYCWINIRLSKIAMEVTL